MNFFLLLNVVYHFKDVRNILISLKFIIGFVGKRGEVKSWLYYLVCHKCGTINTTSFSGVVAASLTLLMLFCHQISLVMEMNVKPEAGTSLSNMIEFGLGRFLER